MNILVAIVSLICLMVVSIYLLYEGNGMEDYDDRDE